MTKIQKKLSKKTTINISPNRKESTTKIVDIDDAPEIPIDKKDNENGNGNGKCRKLLSPPSLKLSTTYTDIITANVIGESEEVDVIGTTRTRIDCVNINTSSCIPDTSTCINIDIDTDRNSFDDAVEREIDAIDDPGVNDRNIVANGFSSSSLVVHVGPGLDEFSVSDESITFKFVSHIFC